MWCVPDEQEVEMAKLRIQTTHKQQVVEVCKCNGGIQILNDGTVNIIMPKHLAIKLGFKEAPERER